MTAKNTQWMHMFTSSRSIPAWELPRESSQQSLSHSYRVLSFPLTYRQEWPREVISGPQSTQHFHRAPGAKPRYSSHSICAFTRCVAPEGCWEVKLDWGCCSFPSVVFSVGERFNFQRFSDNRLHWCTFRHPRGSSTPAALQPCPHSSFRAGTNGGAKMTGGSVPFSSLHSVRVRVVLRGSDSALTLNPSFSRT